MAVIGFPKQLTLNNFKGLDEAPPSANERKGYQLRAETSTTVKYAVDTYSEIKKDGDTTTTVWKVKRNYSPTLVFNMNETWMLKSVKNDKAEAAETLAHEQGHFDISGLCARIYQRKVLQFEEEKLEDLNKKILALQAEISEKIDSLNKIYDEETSIKGTRENQIIRQQTWLKVIAVCKGNEECEFEAPA